MQPDFSAFVDELSKLANFEEAPARDPQPWTPEEKAQMLEELEKKRPPGLLKRTMHGALGAGLGTLAGGLTGKGIEYAAGRTGTNLSPHLPRVGAAVGLLAGAAHGAWQAKNKSHIDEMANYRARKAEIEAL